MGAYMRSTGKKYLLAIISLLLVLSVLVGCATPAAAPAPTEPAKAAPAATAAAPKESATKPAASGGPYKIGANFGLTSTGAAPIGQDYKLGMDAFVDMVNAAGGINGRQLQVVYYDNENSQDKALQLGKKMIQDDKVIGIVADRTATALALVPLTEQEGVILLNGTASFDPTKDKKWTFQDVPRDDIEAVVLMDHVKNNLKVKNIAILHDENQYGTNGSQIAEGIAKGKGLNVTGRISYNNNSADLSTEVARAKASGAEAIVTWGIPPGPANVAKAAQNIGWKVPLVGSVASASPAIIQLGGDAVEGMTFYTAFNGDNPDPDDKPFVDAMKKMGKPASFFGAVGWDAVALIAEGIKKGGDDRAKVRDAMEQLKGFHGVIGVYNMSPTEHNGIAADSLLLTQIKGGKWTVFKQAQ